MFMVPRVNAPLPPLNALRAFEAAARLLSFTRAAHELHVTQTAVSHQMRVLEAHLSVRLFLRLPRRLALTPDGQAYARELGRVSDRIGEATGALQVRPRREILCTRATAWMQTCTPALFLLWVEHEGDRPRPIQSGGEAAPERALRAPRFVHGDRFLRGPIPMRWLAFQPLPSQVCTQLLSLPAGGAGPKYTSTEVSGLTSTPFFWLLLLGNCWSVWSSDPVWLS
jgi:hypothetical protein